jgi:MYXO-CTERM domain-containing protein
MVFGVTQVGLANSAANQKAYLDYGSNDQFPDFTSFTSLDFNFASTLNGTMKCIIRFADAAIDPVEKVIAGSSGLMSFTVQDFGGIDPLNIAAVGPLSIEFQRTGSNASGSLTITNLVANGASIPAPGALALLGVAGLGARRRRA